MATIGERNRVEMAFDGALDPIKRNVSQNAQCRKNIHIKINATSAAPVKYAHVTLRQSN